MPPPRHPKIYHIVHVDRLPSIVADGCLWCDAEVLRRAPQGTTIGMSNIKQRRLKELTLSSHADLHVGDCVPFYFCPRSVMLYLMYQGNHPDLVYRAGQEPIIHLEADLHAAVDWAKRHKRRWSLRYLMLVRITLKTALICPSSTRSIGIASRRGNGRIARNASRPNFCWNTVSLLSSSSVLECMQRPNISRSSMRCQTMDIGQLLRFVRTGTTKMLVKEVP